MATRASGFERIKQFQHKAKIRRLPDEDYGLKLSPWSEIQGRKHGRVDVDRANEIGSIYTQPFDPKPRLRHNPVHHDAFRRYVATDRNFNPMRWSEEGV